MDETDLTWKQLFYLIQDAIKRAREICGGQGCEAFRPYYETPERRWIKCGQCPLEPLSAVIHAFEDKENG